VNQWGVLYDFSNWKLGAFWRGWFKGMERPRKVANHQLLEQRHEAECEGYALPGIAILRPSSDTIMIPGISTKRVKSSHTKASYSTRVMIPVSSRIV